MRFADGGDGHDDDDEECDDESIEEAAEQLFSARGIVEALTAKANTGVVANIVAAYRDALERDPLTGGAHGV